MLKRHAKSSANKRLSLGLKLSGFGDEVHTEVWGPAPVSSLGGRKYYITFADDHARYTRLELLRSKDEALQAYKMFAAWAKTF